MTYTDIAKRLNVSEQSMYQYFFVNDVKSGLIEIGAELGIERLQFYAARHSWATIARKDLHIGKDTINEANRLVVDYIVR